MTTADRQEELAAEIAIDMRLEVVVLAVSDVDRAKRFYGGLGWRLDADFSFDNGCQRRSKTAR